MIIDLTNYSVGDIVSINEKITLDSDCLTRSGKFKGDISLKGEISIVDDAKAAFMGEIEYTLDTQCDSCGDDCSITRKVKFSAMFTDEPEEEDYFFNGRELEPDKAVADSIILDIPSRITCREDCAGVCPSCGTNLNKGKCKCKKQTESANPFSVLRDLDFSVGGADNGSTKG
jgi:uncharacterized protein